MQLTVGNETISPIMPFLAPLSVSMAQQAFTVQTGLKGQGLLFFQEDRLPQWTQLYQRFQPERREAFSLTQQALNRGDFSTRWIIAELSHRYPGKSKPLSHETISRWRTTGLLRYRKDDYPDPDSAIAMLILRSLTAEKTHAWTPKVPEQGGFWEEAFWTCWRQDAPDAPIQTCTVPLPADLPRHALLWTTYLGASLTSPDWLRIGELGCCRWAQTKTAQQTHVWDINQQDLARWGIETTAYQKELDNDAPLTLHMLANLALLKLATERIETMQHTVDLLRTA